MTDINGLRYYEVDFNADGTLDTAGGGGDGGLPAAVTAGGITDLFVLSHGWNSGVDSARDLYQAMFGLLADQLGTHRSSSAAVGVIWPSLVFPDDDPATAPPMPSTRVQLAAVLAPAFPTQQRQLATLGQLLDHRPQDADKLTEFHILAAGLVTTRSRAVEDSGEAALLHGDTETIFRRAALEMAPDAGGGVEGIGNRFAALWSEAREVLRIFSYYEMKNRAGVIGQTGLGLLLAALTGPGGPPRIHLMGHSFGARLVAYALAGLPAGKTGPQSPVKSLTLVQGAFSHFTFASPLMFDASRSRLFGKVRPPVLVPTRAPGAGCGNGGGFLTIHIARAPGPRRGPTDVSYFAPSSHSMPTCRASSSASIASLSCSIGLVWNAVTALIAAARNWRTASNASKAAGGVGCSARTRRFSSGAG